MTDRQILRKHYSRGPWDLANGEKGTHFFYNWCKSKAIYRQ